MPKNIVICCDGTNNEISGHQTNVLRLFRMLVRDDLQISYYDSGIGTQADPTAHRPLRRRLYKLVDAGVGLGVRDNVLEAYRFLMHTYEHGDQIYMFGFSRGAYTVRALAAMIKCCGLMRPEHDNLVAHAWAVFTDEDRTRDDRSRFAGAARVKKVFGREEPVKVHFMGAWDTVTSFGWIWDPQMIPNTATNDEIINVRHALAIDERRAYFRPNHFQFFSGQDELSVWFAGVHADVGGGYPKEEASLSRIPLEWMMGEAVSLGLRLNTQSAEEQLDRIDDADGKPECGLMHDESKKLGWRVIGLLPKRVYSFKKNKMTWKWPNNASRRSIRAGAMVHSSVMSRSACSEFKYKPQIPDEHERADSKPWNI